MTVLWEQVIVLLPIFVISIVITIILIFVTCFRNQLTSFILTIIGLIIAGISSLIVILQDKEAYYFGKLLCVDGISTLYIVLIVIASITSSISVYSWLSNYPTLRRDEFFILLLISSMGGILLIISNHLMMLFLGIELISLPLFGLIGYSFFQKKSIESSFKYVMLSGISSSFLLFGIALIYAEVHCLSFIEIKESLCMQNNIVGGSFIEFASFVILGIVMILVGLLFKLSVVPFHLWTPDVYQGSISAVAMYLATGSKIAVISTLIRFLSIFPVQQYHKVFYISLSVLACASMLFGSIMAIQQDNIKRILAYSSIAHSGYILVAIITSYINNSINQETIGIYLISYLFSNIGIFCIVSLMSNVNTQKDLDFLYSYRGLFWREPALSVMFIIIILSLAGIPITLGFIGKFYLLLTSVSNQLWLLTSVMVISSIISMFYYFKLIINLFLFSEINNDFDNHRFLNNWFYSASGVLIIIVTISILIFGLYPQPIVNIVNCMHLSS